MKLAYSANAYMRFPLPETLRRIAHLGYAGVELMADTPHAWPADLSPRDVDDIRAQLDRCDLHISNINAFMMNRIKDPRQPYWHPSWIEPDIAYRRIRIEHTLRSLDLARDLGVRHISTEPGGPIEDEAQRDAATACFIESLQPVLDRAAKVGVKLLIEPEPGLLIETSDQYLELFDRLNCPYVGLNFDIGHFFCVGESPARAAQKLAGCIDHVHVEDIAASREHHHLIPGDGVIDFEATFAALQGIGYDGWLTVELYPFVENPDEAGGQARRRLLASGHVS